MTGNLAGLRLIPRAGQDRDVFFCELTGCFQTDAFVGAGNQGNFLVLISLEVDRALSLS
jgi:hypothetical protein